MAGLIGLEFNHFFDRFQVERAVDVGERVPMFVEVFPADFSINQSGIDAQQDQAVLTRIVAARGRRNLGKCGTVDESLACQRVGRVTAGLQRLQPVFAAGDMDKINHQIILFSILKAL